LMYAPKRDSCSEVGICTLAMCPDEKKVGTKVPNYLIIGFFPRSR
jgi:hypothetical protein